MTNPLDADLGLEVDDTPDEVELDDFEVSDVPDDAVVGQPRPDGQGVD